MLKRYRYRIYPNEVQRNFIEQTFGCCRLVYNMALDIKIYVYKSQGINLDWMTLANQIPAMRKDYEWMELLNCHTLQSSVKRIDKAFKVFFKGGGYPKFKRKGCFMSFENPDGLRKVDFSRGLLTIPKLKDIPIRISYRFEGKIKTVTISESSTGKYYASILVEDGLQEPKKKPIKKSVGIDLGIKTLAVLSDGTSFENPQYFRESEQRLKVLQRRVSRKMKGSNNQKKARKKVAVQHERIKNQRKDFTHKMTSLIAKSYDTICVEDLKIKNMSKRAKTKQDEQGKYLHNKQAAKSGLNKSIRDAGWGMIIRQLEYKSEWTGNNFVKIPMFAPSSKTCSCCGSINENLTLAQREWTCEICGTEHDRDKNASTNIEVIGVNILQKKSRRGTSVEPVELRRKRRVEAGSQKIGVTVKSNVTKYMLDNACLKTDFVDNRLHRVNNKGAVIEIQN